MQVFSELTKDLLIDAGKVLLAVQGSIVAHEFGHAITAKVLFENPIDIHIGDRKSPAIDKFPSGSKRPFLTIHADGFATGWAGQSKVASKWKQVAMLAAGPICGIASFYAFSKMMHFDHLQISYPIASFALMGLTPFHDDAEADGPRIYKELGASPGFLKWAAAIGYWLFPVAVCGHLMSHVILNMAVTLEWVAVAASYGFLVIICIDW